MALIPELVSNLDFQVNGRTLSGSDILTLLEALVPDKPLKEKRPLKERLDSIQFSESDYYDLVTQEPFKKLLFDYAYFKLLFPRIPQYLELLAQGIEVGKESCMKQALQLMTAYHPQLQTEKPNQETHQHLHLQAMTPRQLEEEYERLSQETKGLLKRTKK